MIYSWKRVVTGYVVKSMMRRVREVIAVWVPVFSIHRKKYFVLQEQKIIYIPVSKAANSTIKIMLLSALGLDAVRRGDPYFVHRNKKFSCFTKRRLPKNFRDYFIFTVIRPDEERLESCYRNKIEDVGKISKRGFEFGEYLGGYLAPTDSYAEYLEKVRLLPNRVRDEHLVSAMYWIYAVHQVNPRLYNIDCIADLREDLRLWGLSVGEIPAENTTANNKRGAVLKCSASLMEEISRA